MDWPWRDPACDICAWLSGLFYLNFFISFLSGFLLTFPRSRGPSPRHTLDLFAVSTRSDRVRRKEEKLSATIAPELQLDSDTHVPSAHILSPHSQLAQTNPQGSAPGLPFIRTRYRYRKSNRNQGARDKPALHPSEPCGRLLAARLWPPPRWLRARPQEQLEATADSHTGTILCSKNKRMIPSRACTHCKAKGRARARFKTSTSRNNNSSNRLLTQTAAKAMTATTGAMLTAMMTAAAAAAHAAASGSGPSQSRTYFRFLPLPTFVFVLFSCSSPFCSVTSRSFSFLPMYPRLYPRPSPTMSLIFGFSGSFRPCLPRLNIWILSALTP